MGRPYLTISNDLIKSGLYTKVLGEYLRIDQTKPGKVTNKDLMEVAVYLFLC